MTDFINKPAAVRGEGARPCFGSMRREPAPVDNRQPGSNQFSSSGSPISAFLSEEEGNLSWKLGNSEEDFVLTRRVNLLVTKSNWKTAKWIVTSSQGVLRGHSDETRGTSSVSVVNFPVIQCIL